ncbi:Acyl-CoA thioesterase 8 [Irineochytrium annulatum]|nr:Acyl-CoA thioesterase 8 [Irineochytrium annulatum]
MPVVPPPEDLPNNEEVLKSWLQDPQTPVKYHRFLEMRLAQPIPIEFKPVKPSRPNDWINPSKQEPKQMVWMRAKGKLPDDLTFHQCVLAYVSDHYLLNTSLLPHGLNSTTTKKEFVLKMIASLDHAIWFHSHDFRGDDWLLYVMESTRTGNGRGLCLGQVFNRQGVLVMSCTQEGMIRAVPRPPKKVADGTKPDEGKPKL